MTATILLVDDDQTTLRFIQEYLEQEGFQTLSAENGSAALRLFFEERPALVVLDVMMPGMDGWEVCARIREMSDVPIVMLTAKISERDKLRGFRIGVDDYVTKPFSLAELTARIRAIIGRTPGQDEIEESCLSAGDLRIDMRKREALKNGINLDLTPTEFRLLCTLTQRAGQAIPREELIEEIWGAERKGGGSALRRYIWFLRSKIEEDPQSPSRIITVRGFGYRLES
jgi:two-component system KDP operon response regulator KdpE